MPCCFAQSPPLWGGCLRSRRERLPRKNLFRPRLRSATFPKGEGFCAFGAGRRVVTLPYQGCGGSAGGAAASCPPLWGGCLRSRRERLPRKNLFRPRLRSATFPKGEGFCAKTDIKNGQPTPGCPFNLRGLTTNPQTHSECPQGQPVLYPKPVAFALPARKERAH